MKKILLFIISILILFSCNDRDNEVELLRKELKELESDYTSKKIVYDGKLFLLNECKRKKRKSVVSNIDYELIGNWDTPVLYGGGSLRLYKENGIYFKTESFPDGSRNTSKMRMVQNGNKKIFNSLERTSSDRWIVYPNGRLEVVDRDGLIYSVRK